VTGHVEVSLEAVPVFLEILAGLLIFTLGLPGLMLHLTVPEETRAIIRKYGWLIYVELFPPVIPVAFLILWVLAYLAGSASYSAWLPHWSAKWNTEWFMLAVALTVAASMHIIATYSPLQFISVLGERLRDHYRRQGVILGDALDDLLTLGMYARSSGEKTLVLVEICRLVDDVTDTPQYQGEELVHLFENLDRVFIGSPHPPSEENARRAAVMLSAAIQRFRSQGHQGRSDHFNARKTSCCLAKDAAGKGFKAVTSIYTDTFREDSEMLFEIGVAAIEAGQYEPAFRALHWLERAAEKSGTLSQNPDTAFLLGFFGHLRAASPDAGGDLVSAYLRNSPRPFDPSLRECLRYARSYHGGSTRLRTADLLAAL
jgi:hypothetical protein